MLEKFLIQCLGKGVWDMCAQLFTAALKIVVLDNLSIQEKIELVKLSYIYGMLIKKLKRD